MKHTPISQAKPKRDRRAPYLFAYDITEEKRARRVRRCLQRWRLSGQYSVHETALLPYLAQELAAEVVDLMDRNTDRLLVGRLSQRGSGPAYIISQSAKHPPLVFNRAPQRLPKQLQAGWYLLAYDITDPPRLQQIHRETAKHCTFTQKSVYIYQGEGEPLQQLIERLSRLIRKQEDDLRLYSLNGPQDLWFPSGPLPPLAGLAQQDQQGLWQWLRGWLKVA